MAATLPDAHNPGHSPAAIAASRHDVRRRTADPTTPHPRPLRTAANAVGVGLALMPVLLRAGLWVGEVSAEPEHVAPGPDAHA
jgi:hypothetical protein